MSQRVVGLGFCPHGWAGYAPKDSVLASRIVDTKVSIIYSWEVCKQKSAAGRPAARMLCWAHGSVHFGDVVRSGLVDVVIEPVGIEQLAGAPPADDGRTGRVVVGEIVVGDVDGKALFLVPEILSGEGIRIILRVAGDEELAGILALYGKDPGVPGDGEELQAGGGPDVALVDLGIPGVGRLEDVVEAAEQGRAGL